MTDSRNANKQGGVQGTPHRTARRPSPRAAAGVSKRKYSTIGMIFGSATSTISCSSFVFIDPAVRWPCR